MDDTRSLDQCLRIGRPRWPYLSKKGGGPECVPATGVSQYSASLDSEVYFNFKVLERRVRQIVDQQLKRNNRYFIHLITLSRIMEGA